MALRGTVAKARMLVVELHLHVGVQIPVDAERPFESLERRGRRAGKPVFVDVAIDQQLVDSRRELPCADPAVDRIEISTRLDLSIGRVFAGYQVCRGELPGLVADRLWVRVLGRRQKQPLRILYVFAQ